MPYVGADEKNIQGHSGRPDDLPEANLDLDEMEGIDFVSSRPPSTGIFNQYIVAVPSNGSGRLLFCWIHKVGCMSFKKLLRPQAVHFLEALPDSRLNHPHAIYDAILHNNSWHKALFYREPLERFLSGYLHLCVKEEVRYDCKNVFGSPNATFDEAVRVLLTQNPRKLDAHFHSQVDFCGGLRRTLPLFDTVEQLDRKTSREAVGRMLRRANVTSEYFDVLYPPEGRWATGHETHASESTEDHYRDPRHVGIVVTFFYDDYALLGIPLPGFAASALRELNRTQDELRLPPSRLERLLQITRERERGRQRPIGPSGSHVEIEDGSAIAKASAPATPLAAFFAKALGILVLLFVLRRRRKRANAASLALKMHIIM